MTTSFIARDGRIIRTLPATDALQIGPIAEPKRTIAAVDARALREYFTHERDQELGRWRDPENPDAVVYRSGPNSVRVLLEADGASFHRRRDGDPNQYGMDTAARYFAANPEQKPWSAAAEGDIWLLDGADHPGELRPYLVSIDTDGEKSAGPRFFSIYRLGWTPGAFPNEFTTGRRLYPEGSDSAPHIRWSHCSPTSTPNTPDGRKKMSADTCKHPDTWFSRTLCPPPCDSMHDICEDCGRPADGCPFNPPGTYNAFAKETRDE